MVTIPHCHERLAKVNNLGETDDWQDLYYLVDYLTFAVGKELPEHPCRRGCAECCRSAPLFPVTTVEWNAIRRKYPELVKQKERAKAFQEILPLMEKMSEVWSSGQKPDAPPYPQDCPFLENGACLVYDARPLICRSYGFFTLKIDAAERLLMCPQAGDSVRQRIGDGEFPLPRWEPYRKAVHILNRDQKIAPLPFWIFTES